MKTIPISALNRLASRKKEKTQRTLKVYPKDFIDFLSNDYLGLGKDMLQVITGSTEQRAGARLISGNSAIYEKSERILSDLFGQEALIFIMPT